MSRKFFKLLCLFLLIAATTYCQTADSLIYAEGKILNAATKEPVTARVTYQSLPYGNKIGTLNNSTYSFPLFDNEKYSIIVEAPGYNTAKYMIDPAEANENRKVIKDIELAVGEIKKHEVGHVMRLDNVIFPVGKIEDQRRIVFGTRCGGGYDAGKPNNGYTIGRPYRLSGRCRRIILNFHRNVLNRFRRYITSKGVARNRIKTKAFGGTMPLSRDNTPEAHRLNRRVELRILEN